MLSVKCEVIAQTFLRDFFHSQLHFSLFLFPFSFNYVPLPLQSTHDGHESLIVERSRLVEHYILKRRLLWRFVLDIWESRKFLSVKDKATVNVHRDMLLTYAFTRSYILLYRNVRGMVQHISAWASRCSFRLTGQCESLQVWDEQQVRTPTFEPVLNFADIDYQYVTSGNLMRWYHNVPKL